MKQIGHQWQGTLAGYEVSKNAAYEELPTKSKSRVKSIKETASYL